MKKSKFQFTDPELEKLEFDINTEYNADKFDGIVLESHTQVKRNDSNEAYSGCSGCCALYFCGK